MANCNLPHVILIGDLIVNLNHLKIQEMILCQAKFFSVDQKLVFFA